MSLLIVVSSLPSSTYRINPLRPGDACMRQGTRSSLAQMCLVSSTPSHCMVQTMITYPQLQPRNIFNDDFQFHSSIVIQGNAFECVIDKISPILNFRAPRTPYSGRTRSILWLLKYWLLLLPDHRQKRYWQHSVYRSLFARRKNFRYLLHIRVKKWKELQLYVFCFQKKSACKGLRP